MGLHIPREQDYSLKIKCTNFFFIAVSFHLLVYPYLGMAASEIREDTNVCVLTYISISH